jgi:nicotinamidase/pyrazinamidase
LTAAARAAGITIVHTADDHDLHDEEISAEPDFVETFPAHCLRGTPGADRLPETAAAPGAADIPPDGAGIDMAVVAAAAEVVLRKNRFDAFSNPAAAPLLRALAPETVVVYGVALEVCDRYAVEGMFALDPRLDIVVVEDAVAALDPTRGKELLEDWRRRGVRVLSTDQILLEVGYRGDG